MGDGFKHELIKHANGKIEVTPNKPTLTVVEKGSSILGGDKTEELMKKVKIVPQYSIGSFLGSAVDFVKGGFSKIAHGAEGFGDAITHPKQLLNTAINHFVDLSKLKGTIFDMATGTVKYVAKSALGWLKKQLSDFSVGDPGGSGVKRWISAIKKAAAMSHVSLSSGELSAILKRIAQESNGSPTVTNHWDINARLGHPSTGLLQYIQPTFDSYKRKGHGNIHSGFDQLLALFNDSNWYRDIAHAGGWGPTGARRFANGGLVTRHTFAELAENNMPEMVVPLGLNNRSLQLMSWLNKYMAYRLISKQEIQVMLINQQHNQQYNRYIISMLIFQL
ncbi:MAG: hypothetical protein LKI94_05570 [Sporolactobacillus sp.]|nr:hypothetical protein [Sporolactobacillus sp.]